MFMNCSFNIRYKPRTTRAFTKSDLTVYDSAGNTALNALTVYGKSEVVDGAITSAGDSGSIEIETCEKNLLDPTKLVTQNITYTNGTLSGTAENFYTAYRNGIPILFDKTRQITFSAKIYTNGTYLTGRGLLVEFVYTDNTSDTLETFNSTTEPRVFTLTSNSAKQLQYIAITYGVAVENMWYLSEIQLEYNSTATAYEPYNGTMATFTTGTPLRGITDGARDVMAWNGSAGTVTKKCNKAKLTDLMWNTTNVTSLFRALVSDMYVVTTRDERNKHFVCSAYNASTTLSISAQMDDPTMLTDDREIFIYDTRYSQLTDFVASLSEAELVYELATPTTQHLSSTENASIAGLRTFEPQTHVQNNAQTDMTVDYTIRVPTI